MDNDSLRKEIDLEIPYVDIEGSRGVKKVHVSFISTRIQRAYADMLNKVADIIAVYHEINTVKSDIGASMIDTADYSLNEDGSIDVKKLNLKERRRKYRDLQYRYKNLTDRLKEYDKTFFDDKFTLIVMILRRNGVQDPELLSRDWWMDCVDSHDVMAFIENACTKDDDLVLDKKKEWAK